MPGGEGGGERSKHRITLRNSVDTHLDYCIKQDFKY